MRTPANTLGDLLLGQTRGRVLALLYGDSSESFFVREIARHAETSVGSVQRELEKLAGFGLIERMPRGMQVFYRANRKHPIFAELHSLVAKTSGVFHLIDTALRPLQARIDTAFVYGSMARGEENAESDIDLMVIGEVILDDVLAGLAPVEKTVGRAINPTVYSPGELRTKLKKGNHFLNAIARAKKVFVIGDEVEFRKVGGIRLAEA